MEKLSIRLKDKEFAHAYNAGNGDFNFEKKYIEWYRGNDYRDITVFTDRCLSLPLSDSRYNIAYILEPPAFKSGNYEYIRQNPKKFDYVMATDNSMRDYLGDRFIWVNSPGTWIEPHNRKIHEKTKNISAVFSEKKQLVGHRLRHEIVKIHKSKIDMICGRGYKPISNMIEAMKDFRYSIAVENSLCDCYFTNKITDCFLTGTVPIYFGHESIKRHFNEDGIIFFDRLDNLENIFLKCSDQDYKSRLPAIKDNFERAKKWSVTEDWIYENFLFNIVKELPNKMQL